MFGIHIEYTNGGCYLPAEIELCRSVANLTIVPTKLTHQSNQIIACVENVFTVVKFSIHQIDCEQKNVTEATDF